MTWPLWRTITPGPSAAIRWRATTMPVVVARSRYWPPIGPEDFRCAIGVQGSGAEPIGWCGDRAGQLPAEWSRARTTFGSGAPRPREQSDRIGHVQRLETMTRIAAPGAHCSGTAAGAYERKTTAVPTPWPGESQHVFDHVFPAGSSARWNSTTKCAARVRSRTIPSAPHALPRRRGVVCRPVAGRVIARKVARRHGIGRQCDRPSSCR